jgi:hypothetical protein
MPSPRSLAVQLYSNAPAFAAIFGVVGLLLSVAVVLHVFRDTPMSSLTRDPNAVAGARFYVGFISQIGVLAWAAAVAVCLFGRSLLPADDSGHRRFLVDSALLTTVLATDDLFLLHEHVFPVHLGLSEMFVYAVHFAFVGYYLLRYSRLILQTEYALLSLAFICFGGSLFVDMLPSYDADVAYLLEDGAKLAGIASWLAFYLRSTASFVAANRVLALPETLPQAMTSRTA